MPLLSYSNQFLLTLLSVSQSIITQPINEIAEAIGVLPEEYDLYGQNKSKIALSIRDRLKDRYSICNRGMRLFRIFPFISK